MSQSASKRRICSYDMVEVRPDGSTLAETEGGGGDIGQKA
jgi:hypothetical protein